MGRVGVEEIGTVTLRCERSEPRRATATGRLLPTCSAWSGRFRPRRNWLAVYPSRATSWPPQDDGIFSRNRQLRLAFGHLHVEHREQGCGSGVVAHQQDELDQLGRREKFFDPCESFRGDLVVTEGLAAEFDDRGVGFVEALRTLAVFDDVDDVLRHTFLQRFGLMGGPFELAVHLAGDRKDGDLAGFRIEHFEAQIIAELGAGTDGLWAVKRNAARSAQTDDRLSRRRGAVEGSLAGF